MNSDAATIKQSLTVATFAPCPCGQVPTKLRIIGERSKWAHVCGNCCDDWMLEFRTNYHKDDSPECMALAVAAWNAAPRGKA